MYSQVNGLSRSLFASTLIIGILVISMTASATVPLGSPVDSLWGRPEGSLSPAAARYLRINNRLPSRDIRETLGQFRQTCMFLDSMQDHDPESGVFGGLHEGEGEQLWGIIETDNTQEAIRVWCEYADYFEDPDRFRQNVEDAWTYCDSFPAWEESEPDGFYAMHNAGWGLIATIGYRRAYDDSRDEYGRLCAEHLIENVPEITPNMADNLMPLVAGWSAGTLYEYGLEVDNRDYQEEAIRIAGQVKDWIDEIPTRLNRNEIWALCGGTAMWGVLRSLVREDREVADWAQSQLENMDVLAGNGNWNVSWNIWYAHAWIAAYEYFQEPEYLRNAETIIDSLLALDTDDDGGIPATIGDANNRDQAWVSAYTAWMGLRNLFAGIPEVDVSLLEVASPANNRPWPVGTPLHFSLRAQQNGNLQNLEDVTLNMTGSWVDSETFDLEGWEPRIINLNQPWTPTETGIAQIAFGVEAAGDVDDSNDSLFFETMIRDTGTVIFATITGDAENPGGTFLIENLDFPQVIPSVTLDYVEDAGLRSEMFMEGLYRITFTPRFPFPITVLDSIHVQNGQPATAAIELFQPHVLIINNDLDTTRERYFTESFELLNSPVRLWRNQDGQVPFTEGFEAVVYYTGNRAETEVWEDPIPEPDREMLADVLESGRSVLVTGQNIAEMMFESQFLNETLHTYLLTENTRSRQVLGREGDELMGGNRLLLIGNQGAANQSSTDGIAPGEGGIACAFYADRGDTAAAVRWTDESGGRGIFCGFGIEAISGSGGTTTREEFLSEALTWLGVDLGIESKQEAITPLSPLMITNYPNPFNNYTKFNLIGIRAPNKYFLRIVDQNGRLVRTLNGDAGETMYWDGMSASGRAVATGSYFVTIESVGRQEEIPPVLRIMLMK